jgi:hypothetical protein
MSLSQRNEEADQIADIEESCGQTEIRAQG